MFRYGGGARGGRLRRLTPMRNTHLHQGVKLYPCQRQQFEEQGHH